MFERSAILTGVAPSAYLDRLFYDTLLHDPAALRYLVSRVGLDRLVIGTDDGFPPADHDPLGSLRRAELSAAEIHQIAEVNPRRLFARL